MSSLLKDSQKLVHHGIFDMLNRAFPSQSFWLHYNIPCNSSDQVTSYSIFSSYYILYKASIVHLVYIMIILYYLYYSTTPSTSIDFSQAGDLPVCIQRSVAARLSHVCCSAITGFGEPSQFFELRFSSCFDEFGSSRVCFHGRPIQSINQILLQSLIL